MRFAFQVARIRAALIAALLSCAATCFSFGATPNLTVDLGQSAGPVSPRMYGLMTEEINHSYDGGLYGELVQNRALLDDAKTPSHYAAVQSGSSAATIALDPKQRWTLNGRIGHCAGALIVHYPTKMEPELDALAILADRFPALIFTLRYYEVHHGLRGYAIYGPSRAWRTCQEEHVDVASETRLFPRHYPGSVAWTETAAVKSKIKFRPQLK